MPPVPAVSVVIPARNSAATIGCTLEALASQDLADPYEVLVVDDGSEDETAAIVERAGPPFRLLREAGAGPAEARNRGASEARAPVLAFTDADCAPTRGWLRAGLEAMRSADLVQGAVEPDPAARRYPLQRTLWVVGEVGLYETANLFVRRELFERLGGFEDWLPARIGKPLAEDVWFGWRARRDGATVRFCFDALVHHAVLPMTAREVITEGLRRGHFPAMAARMPELRETLFHRRLFLSRRTAQFDAAALALLAALLTRRRLPLLAGLPYGWSLIRPAIGWRRHAPRVIAANLLADASGLAALAAGSVRARTPVL
jgi:glycosyltransferase involved in cell wall biosynthesis